MLKKINTLYFIIYGRYVEDDKFNDHTKKGVFFTHAFAFIAAILLHPLYKPKVLVTGMAGRNMGNDFIDIFTYLFVAVSLILISDLRSLEKRQSGWGLRYYVRSIVLILLYSLALYWLFFLNDYMRYGVIHFSPFESIRLKP